MGATSAANRQRWKNPESRHRQSIAVRGRKFTPRDPPRSYPAEIENLASILAKADISVLSASPTYGTAYPRQTWTLTAVDPDPAAIVHRYQRYANEIGFVLLQCASNRLRRCSSVGVAFVMAPKP